jgi:hypothetical protein
MSVDVEKGLANLVVEPDVPAPLLDLVRPLLDLALLLLDLVRPLLDPALPLLGLACLLLDLALPLLPTDYTAPYNATSGQSLLLCR